MIEANTRVVPVTLSGGTGSRLWPVSRESFPKQFWPLLGKHTMIQETALRAHGVGFAPPLVVSNNEHRFVVAEQLREAGVTGARILLEPVGRNSAPAILAAPCPQDRSGASFRPRLSIRQHPLHRAAGRGWHRTLGRKRRRQL